MRRDLTRRIEALEYGSRRVEAMHRLIRAMSYFDLNNLVLYYLSERWDELPQLFNLNTLSLFELDHFLRLNKRLLLRSDSTREVPCLEIIGAYLSVENRAIVLAFDKNVQDEIFDSHELSITYEHELSIVEGDDRASYQTQLNLGITALLTEFGALQKKVAELQTFERKLPRWIPEPPKVNPSLIEFLNTFDQHMLRARIVHVILEMNENQDISTLLCHRQRLKIHVSGESSSWLRMLENCLLHSNGVSEQILCSIIALRAAIYRFSKVIHSSSEPFFWTVETDTPE